MSLTNNYNVEELTKEEYDAAIQAIKEVRIKNEREMEIARAEAAMEAIIQLSIERIGLAETKALLRKMNKTLREITDNDKPF